MTKTTRRAVLGGLGALALAGAASAEPTMADLIVVYKSDRRLYLYAGNRVIRRYRIDLGWAPEGDKEYEGDGRTPEGTYIIDRRNPRSNYHLSLGISYPTPVQVAEAEQNGVDPGGDIFIHGGRNLMRFRDWTAGCIAVNNRAIEEIWRLVPDGTPIVIRP